MASGAKVTAIKIMLSMVIPPEFITCITMAKMPYKLVTIKVATLGWIFFSYISSWLDSSSHLLSGSSAVNAYAAFGSAGILS